MKSIAGKWRTQKIFSVVLVFGSSFLAAQNQTQSNKNNNKEEVIIEEKWRGFSWTNDCRRTVTYDSQENCISELTERWNGSRWDRDLLVQSTYDGLQHQISSCKFKPKGNSSGWDLTEGYRSIIDTTVGKSNRVVLYDADWDPVKKIWNASDSIFYDKNGRIIKSVDKKISFSDSTNDSLIIIETEENNYLNENSWVETSKTWRSDTRKVESERYRYRKISISSEKVYAIDYWDNKMNRWIPNTAKLFQKKAGNQVEVDSIEEMIDEESIPVYLSAEIRDSNGNILQQRNWQKNFDEVTKKWSGKYVKWDRVYNAKTKNYTIAESTFIADSDGKKWNLVRYENKICKIPSAGDITESGNFEALTNAWQYEKSFDTLASFGVFIDGEYYYDEAKKKWLPNLRYNITKEADSTVISTEILDLQKNEWEFDSLFVVKTDSQGKIKSRINYAWAKAGILNEDWIKVSRMTYIR